MRALIIECMNRRDKEVVMTLKAKVGRFLKLFAPGVVEDMALAAVKDDSKPHQASIGAPSFLSLAKE